MWYRRGEEPFMHIHTNFERNWTNNVNFTANVIRARSSKSDNFTAEIITHTFSTVLSRDENQYLVGPPHASMRIRMLFIEVWILTWGNRPHSSWRNPLWRRCACAQMHVVATRTRYWFSSLDNAVWCDRCVVSCEIVTFDTWPRPHYMCCEINIVCSISLKSGVNVHEWYIILHHAGIDSRRWTTLCAHVISVSKLWNCHFWHLTPH